MTLSACWVPEPNNPTATQLMTCPNHANYEQSIRNRGKWLLENETTLKAIQFFLMDKFWEAYENDNSQDLDAFLCEIEDHMMLLCKVVANLRQAEFWPKTEPVADAEPKPAE